MTDREKALMKKLQSMFGIEAKERLGVMYSSLVELENSTLAEKRGIITENIFREAHSLKGAARAVGMLDIELICQSLESALAIFRQNKEKLAPGVFDLFHKALDTVGECLSPGVAAPVDDVSGIICALDRLSLPEEDSQAIQPESVYTPVPEKSRPDRSDIITPAFDEKSYQLDTVRISASRLDSLLLQTEEMLSVKLASGQREADLIDVKTMLELWEKEWQKVYPQARNLGQILEGKPEETEKSRNGRQLLKLHQFLDWNHSFMKQAHSKVKALVKAAGEDRRWIGGTVDSILENVKKTVMLPFTTVLEPFPKMVRDLARDQGKEVELLLQGTEVEADKRILEEIKDPLIHLVRNCIDHGIERPEIREDGKKPRKGTVKVAIAQVNSGRIEIVVADDGAGINLDRVRDAAVKMGVLNGEKADGLEGLDFLSLIFQPELSTSPVITNISGRGLGMAIVRETVEKLGGSISVDTGPKEGTLFRIILPVTVATFRGILVRVSDRMFVIPTANVERVVRVKKDEIETVENRETVILGGRPVSLAHLCDILEIPPKGRADRDQGRILALTVRAGEKCVAFAVDEILEEQEVLVKSLGRQLLRVRNISGATVLGSGKVVPILNAHDLIKTAARAPVAPMGTGSPAGEAENKRKAILVVEDSITSRMLLKNIIESAGFYVKTSVDGVDALGALKNEEFDLVVSDVEMPRLNGFDLTARIRADGELSQIPVVLVTSLGSREDRERGVEVGADAYIVKSGFDHNNLLEVINRLI